MPKNNLIADNFLIQFFAHVTLKYSANAKESTLTVYKGNVCKKWRKKIEVRTGGRLHFQWHKDTFSQAHDGANSKLKVNVTISDDMDVDDPDFKDKVKEEKVETGSETSDKDKQKDKEKDKEKSEPAAKSDDVKVKNESEKCTEKMDVDKDVTVKAESEEKGAEPKENGEVSTEDEGDITDVSRKSLKLVPTLLHVCI